MPPDIKISQAFSLISKRADVTMHHFSDQITIYNRAYEHQNLPLSDLLRSITPEPEEIINERRARERRKQAEADKQRRQEEKKQYLRRSQEQHRTLEQQVEAADEPWLMSSRARKQQGLKEFNESLLLGFETATKAHIQVALPKEHVPLVTSILARLQQLADKSLAETGDLIQAKSELESAIAEHHNLASQIAQLYEGLRVRSLALPNGMTYPQMLLLPTHIEQLRDQWPNMEQLLREKWPKNGATFANQLRTLLFNPGR